MDAAMDLFQLNYFSSSRGTAEAQNERERIGC